MTSTRLMQKALFIAFFATASTQGMSDLDDARPFLKQHCNKCHGANKQENDIRFDTLSTDLTDEPSLRTWQAIVDQLNQGSMPPEGSLKPTVKETRVIIDDLTVQLRHAYSKRKSTQAKTVIRRLNRFELRMTLRDLLYLTGDADFRYDTVTKLEDRNGNGRAQWSSEDPTREFPADEIEEGFDNIGDRLVMSDFLLKHIITTADHCLKLATHFEKKPSTLIKRRFFSPLQKGGPQSLQRWSRELNPGYDGIYQRYLEPGASAGGRGRVSPAELSRGVGVTGRYRIRIEASAHNQKHPWGDLIKTNQDEPMLLSLLVADSKRGGGENPTTQPLKIWELTADEVRRTFTFEANLDETWYPFLGWENGSYDRGLTPSKLIEKHFPEAYQAPPGKDAPKQEKQAYEPAMAKHLFNAGYKGPHLRIYSLTLEPLDTSWPPKSHVALYGKNDQTPTEKLLLRFASRAFRRPVKSPEIVRYVRLVEAERAAGQSRAEALRTGYTAILASPRFYYLQESTGRLDSFALASRLSYFLWSSMPDEQLLALAADDKLIDHAVLKQQIERMLDDPRSAAFIRRFPERWLQIHKLGTMPPANGFYYHRAMEPELRDQMDAYFGHLVKSNGSILQIIDSDYTFLSERLAQWIYKRKDVLGDHFRKVPAKPPHGGGMLTMPAAMTATANGVDTSPVVRGVWVLESLLGTPPSPAPPDVEPLSPDLRDAKSIREQLVAHRKQETCNRCHRKIDPLGFAFENFDHLGIWRTHYRGSSGNLKIDPASTLADGRTITDVTDLKKMLLDRQELFARNLIERMLTYASGRRLEPIDRGEVDRIAAELDKQGLGIRNLIKLVVQSEVFLSK